MRCEDMNDCHDDEKNEQGHVKDVPKPEETLVKCKGRSPLGGANMLCDKIFHSGKLLALHAPRPPAPPAFDRDHLPRIGNQTHTNGVSAPADHRQQDKPAENALGGGRTKLREVVQSCDDAIGDLRIRADKSPQLVGIGLDLLGLRFTPVHPKVDFAVKIPTDDATYRNDKHRHERDTTVD